MAEGSQFCRGVQTAQAVLLYLTDIIAQDAVFLQGKKQVPKVDLYFTCLIEDD